MKTLFNLLKLISAFQKLLNEFFESERKRLQDELAELKKIQVYDLEQAHQANMRALGYERENQNLRAHITALLSDIADRDTQIAELKNATTKKLQAVDTLPADDVWAGVLRPRPGPQLRVYDRDE